MCEGVDTCVTKESNATVVGARDGRSVLHGVAADGGKVVALVDVLEHGGAGVNVIAGKLDTARGAGDETINFGLEVRCLDE